DLGRRSGNRARRSGLDLGSGVRSRPPGWFAGPPVRSSSRPAVRCGKARKGATETLSSRTAPIDTLATAVTVSRNARPKRLLKRSDRAVAAIDPSQRLLQGSFARSAGHAPRRALLCITLSREEPSFIMKKPRVVRLARSATLCCALGAWACGDDGGTTTVFVPTSATTTDAGTATTTGGTLETSATASTTTTGTGGVTSTLTSTTGEMDTCTIASLTLFNRSDTDAGWDDNDFSDVTIESGCPTIVNVTWPHEAD